MVNFDTVIRSFGSQALRLQIEESLQTDMDALAAINNPGAPRRTEIIRDWLQSYRVFQGIEGPKRSAIAVAVAAWADGRDKQRNLSTVDSLVTAHREMMAACEQANHQGRGFTSLGSKALWLCYPQSVPLFDRFAQCALHVISKLEADIEPLPNSESEYHKFVHIWMTLYKRYAESIQGINIGEYPYRVRIFDKILWLLGEPRYGRRESIRE